MERLTKRLDGSIIFPAELLGVTLLPDNETMCKLLTRLAAYEDSGMEPEKVVFLKRVVEDAFSDKPEFTEHLRELLRAERDGRLVVLPCKEFYEKAGDLLYLTYGGEVTEVVHGGASIDVDGKPTIIVVAEDAIFPWREPIAEYDTDPTDWCVNTETITSDDFGKTVFLSHEEAEAALGNERDDDNET